MNGSTRLYAAAIAGASGAYSVWSATTGMGMGPSGWIMLIVGIVVLLHGALLVGGVGGRLGGFSGALMILYAAVMLLNQVLVALEIYGDRGPPMGMMPDSVGMAWDPAMVLFALLMLVSGVLMTRNGGAEGM